MSFIQNLLVKFLSEDTKREIALAQTLTPKESLNKAVVALIGQYVPATNDAIGKVAYAVSEHNGGKLIGNNQLAADKAARTYLTDKFGVLIGREDLNALIAARRAYDAQ